MTPSSLATDSTPQHYQSRCKPDGHDEWQKQQEKEQDAEEDRNDDAAQRDAGLGSVDGACQHAENRNPEDRNHHSGHDEHNEDRQSGIDETDDEQWSGALTEAAEQMAHRERIATIERATSQHQAAAEDREQNLQG